MPAPFTKWLLVLEYTKVGEQEEWGIILQVYKLPQTIDQLVETVGLEENTNH